MTSVTGAFTMCFILVLLTLDGAEAMLSVPLKALRMRFFNDANCTVPSSWPTLYASTDGSCLCYSTHIAMSEEDKGLCAGNHAGSAVVVGDSYNAMFTTGTGCYSGEDTISVSNGTLGVCYAPPGLTPRMGDVVTVHEPLYVWQLFLIGLGCLAVVIVTVCLIKRRKNFRSGNSSFQHLT